MRSDVERSARSCERHAEQRVRCVDEAFLRAEREAMRDVRIAPTNDRSVVGVMNEFAFHGQLHWDDGLQDLAQVIPFPCQPAADVREEVASSPTRSVYRLKVTLLDTKPPIWRRVLVDGASTLDHVHEVIQAAFGWWNYHLHEFEVGSTRYGIPDPDNDWGEPARDERRTRLDSIANEGSSLQYTYDFGDRWNHQIVIEEVVPASTGVVVPACIDGRRACPPEDCGGTWGYRELLDILADPTHPEHDERRTWIGSPFDPEAFDPGEFDDNLRNGS